MDPAKDADSIRAAVGGLAACIGRTGQDGWQGDILSSQVCQASGPSSFCFLVLFPKIEGSCSNSGSDQLGKLSDNGVFRT